MVRKHLPLFPSREKGKKKGFTAKRSMGKGGKMAKALVKREPTELARARVNQTPRKE